MQEVASAFIKPRWNMDNEELIRWVLALGATPDERIAVLDDLLKHKQEDHMDPIDESIIRSVLTTVWEDKWRSSPENGGSKPVPQAHPAYEDEENDAHRFV